MQRVLCVVGVLALQSCSIDEIPRVRADGGEDAGYREPNFPDRFGPETSECFSCTVDPRAGCSYGVHYECRGGGSCGREIPCDPSCCPADVVEHVGLDAEPWGPIIAAARRDPRPPSGAIAVFDGPDLSLIRPAIATTTWPILRLPTQPIRWAWSGTSELLLFTSSDNAAKIQRVDAEQRDPSTLAITTHTGWFDLAPDGQHIAAIQSTNGSTMPNALTLHDLTKPDVPPLVLPIDDGSLSVPMWSADSHFVALAMNRGSYKLMRIVDADARTGADFPREHQQLHGAAWHPGGAFLAVWRRESGHCSLRLISRDGLRATETPVLEPSDRCPELAFSPDGRHLALARWPEDRSVRALDILPLADLQHATTLTDWLGNGQLRWLSDADALALSHWAGWVAPCERCSYNHADPRLPKPAAAAPLSSSKPGAISRAGLLAFVDRVDDTPQIHVVAPSGGKTRILTAIAGGAVAPAWSPDGRGLAFLGASDQRLRVLDIEADAIYTPRMLDGRLGPPTWADNGGALAATLHEPGDSDPRSAQVWTWASIDGHWGSVTQTRTQLLGSLDAAPVWASDGQLLTSGPFQGFERLARAWPNTKVEWLDGALPRMIAPQQHPGTSLIAAWVGAGGHYELAWVFVDEAGTRWQATGLRYDATGAAADVADPSPIAFAPDGSAFAFARPNPDEPDEPDEPDDPDDPERGGVRIEVAPTLAPTHSRVLAHSNAGFSHVSWSSAETTKLLARTELPRHGAQPPTKRRPQ